MDDIKLQTKLPYRVCRLYKSKNNHRNMLVGLPKKMSTFLQDEQYVKLYLDKINNIILIGKIESGKIESKIDDSLGDKQN